MSRHSFCQSAPVAVVVSLLVLATMVSFVSAEGNSQGASPLATQKAALQQRSLEECAALGFQREVVRCPHCETLLGHTGSTELQQECLSCCTSPDASDEREVLYTSAKIVTPFLEQLLATPSYISRFVEKYKDEPYFSKLALINAGNRFSVPELVLVADGGDDLHIPLHRIDADQVHDLLQKKLNV